MREDSGAVLQSHGCARVLKHSRHPCTLHRLLYPLLRNFSLTLVQAITRALEKLQPHSRTGYHHFSTPSTHPPSSQAHPFPSSPPKLSTTHAPTPTHPHDLSPSHPSQAPHILPPCWLKHPCAQASREADPSTANSQQPTAPLRALGPSGPLHGGRFSMSDRFIPSLVLYPSDQDHGLHQNRNSSRKRRRPKGP